MRRTPMLVQFPFPPPPDMPFDPPGMVEQLLACILVVLLTFETIVLVLPEKWRDRISALQFGPKWAAKRSERQ
jgi:hypothetical protein